MKIFENKNILCLLMACALILLAASCVSASDTSHLNTTEIQQTEETNINIENTDYHINETVTSTENSHSQISMKSEVQAPSENSHSQISMKSEVQAPAENSTKNIDDLNSDISNLKPGSTYNINQDYNLTKNALIIIKSGNTVINGNGHIIDANNNQAGFYIFADNVTLKNIIFKNFKNDFTPVIWLGNNGFLSDCTFCETSAESGGAVKWNGKNGKIQNCRFINSTARIVAGAVYINDENLQIENSTFINCGSQLAGEAVYISPKVKHYAISSRFNNALSVIEGSRLNLDEKYLKEIHNIKFIKKDINIVPLIYFTIIRGGINHIDQYTTFYGRYLDNSTFEFVISANIADGMSYEKHLLFTKVKSINDIFRKLPTSSYDVNQNLYKTVKVSNLGDYEKACSLSSDIFSKFIKSLPKKDRTNIVKSINVVFTKNLDIKSKMTWNPKDKKFDVININGNGSRVYCESEDDDENKFSTINEDTILAISNLKIEGFNTAIENFGGTGYLNNVTLYKNRMNYLICRDWGAAIINSGRMYCTNCKFIDNYAKYGGAIFNQGVLQLNNCSFKGNYAYGGGDHICNAQNGVVMFNGKDWSNGIGLVHYEKSLSATTSRVLVIASTVASVAAGVAAGILTANPAIGFAVGFGVGAAIGAATSAVIISNTFDVNYNRLQTAVTLIVGNALAGGFGEVFGGTVISTGISGLAYNTFFFLSYEGASLTLIDKMCKD